MPTMYIKGYEVEISGEPLIGGDTWGAYVSIYSSSKNPIDSRNIYPKTRVAEFRIFLSKEAAVQDARKAGVALVKRLSSD